MTSHRTLVAVAVVVVVVLGSAGAVSIAGRQAPDPAAAAGGKKTHTELPDTEATTCLVCHEGQDKAKVPHAPVEAGMCSTCHEFSGTGDETTVALAGGAASDNTAPLCTMCHDDVGTAVKLEHAHAPAAMGECVTCHNPHGSDQPRILTAEPVELCGMCHDDVATATKLEHAHAPAAAGECVTCHNPHGSEQPRILTAEPAELCGMCHDDVATATKLEHAHAPAAAGECATCHNPHGSERERLLTSSQVELCTTCHDDVSAELALENSHAPAKVACAACHDPHGSKQPMKLRAATNDLCLECHLVTSRAKTTLFGRPVSGDVVALISPDHVIRLDRSRRFGHPLMNHPVSGPKDPVNAEKPLTCISCHLPHGAEGPALQRYAEQSPSEACVKCH